jgi:predicted nucleic acid-binding protein
VATEVEKGRAGGVDLPDLRTLGWVEIRIASGVDRLPKVPDLGAGEREVLAMGVANPGALLIIDERLGRFCAEALKLPYTGTLGILLRAKAEGRIARIGPMLDRLDSLGFRLASKTRLAVLKHAGE